MKLKTSEAQKQSYTVKIISIAKYFAKNIGDGFVSILNNNNSLFIDNFSYLDFKCMNCFIAKQTFSVQIEKLPMSRIESVSLMEQKCFFPTELLGRYPVWHPSIIYVSKVATAMSMEYLHGTRICKKTRNTN